jgi:hypothetical protein
MCTVILPPGGYPFAVKKCIISYQSAHEGGKVFRPMHWPPFYPSRDIPGSHFCWRLSRSQDHSAAGKIMSIKNSNDTIGNRTRDLPACSAVPQPTACSKERHCRVKIRDFSSQKRRKRCS